MKRIKAACLLQTLHFELKEELGHEGAARAVSEEVAHYKEKLERSRTKYRVTEETTLPDGSVLLKLKKQYNSYSCGDYMD